MNATGTLLLLLLRLVFLVLLLLLMGVVFSLKDIIKSFEDFRRHVGRQVIELTLVSLHGPVRRDVIRGLGLG